MHDNAPTYTAIVVREALEDMQIEVICLATSFARS